MKSPLSLLALALLLALSSAKAQADEAYFANSTLSLGSGFQPSNPAAGKQQCVIAGPAAQHGDPGAVKVDPQKVNFSMAEATSERETYQKLGFSVDMSARFGVFKGNGSFSKEDESTSSSHSVSWIVYSQVDWGDEQLRGTGPGGRVTLTPDAEKLLRRGRDEDMENFRRMCGSEYVSGVHKGAVVFVKYTMSDADETTRKKMKALLSASVSMPLGNGGSLNSQYSSEFNELVRNKKINIEVQVAGGDGIRTIARLTKEGVNLDSVKQLMSEHIGALTISNAASMRYTSTSFDTLGWHPTDRTQELDRYAGALDVLTAQGERLKHILNPANADDQDALSLEQIVAYKAKLSERAREIKLLSRSVQDCEKTAKKCDASRFERLADEEIHWPTSGCGIAGCLRCNASSQCTHCSARLSGENDAGLTLALGGSAELFCNNMPPGAKLRVTAGGTVHNDGFYQDPYHSPPAFTGWQQQLQLTVKDAGSIQNEDVYQGHPDARDRTLMVPPLSTTVPSQGTVQVTVKNINSGIWPTTQTSVVLRSDFLVDVLVTEDPTPDGWAAYSALNKKQAGDGGQPVESDNRSVKKTGTILSGDGTGATGRSVRGLN